MPYGMNAVWSKKVGCMLDRLASCYVQHSMHVHTLDVQPFSYFVDYLSSC